MEKQREDPQPDHVRGPKEGKGRPEDHGRPVPPHRSSAQILKRVTKPS